MIVLCYNVVPCAPGPLVRGNFIATDVYLVSAETSAVVMGFQKLHYTR